MTKAGHSARRHSPLRARVAVAILPFAFFVCQASASARAMDFYTFTGAGGNDNFNNSNNWAQLPPDEGQLPSNTSDNNFAIGRTCWLRISSPYTNPNNNYGQWNITVAGLEFYGGFGSNTLNGDNFGFIPADNGTENQYIRQNVSSTPVINVGAFAFRSESDSQIELNSGDLVISSANMYIDMAGNTERTLYIKGDNDNRQTVTFAGNVNRSGSGKDPDVRIQNNKRALVTGALNNGQGDDDSVFVESGVLGFGGAGNMSGGRAVVGAGSGAGDAALLLSTAGSAFSRQVKLQGGSSGRRVVGGANTGGTVTYSGEFVSGGAGDYDLRAAGGGTVNISGVRNLNAGVFVNRPDGGTTFDGTVTLSANTTSTEWTALEAGTLQFSDFNQLGSSHFEFNASSGNSGTLRYTGGSTTTTKAIYIDNSGITRAAIDVSQGGTTLTWNGDGNINRNLTKVGAGTLVFAGSRISDGAGVAVEAGTLVLTGTSTYAGATTVSGGRLAVNGALGNTAVTVQNAAELGGEGSIVGALAVLSGGTLSPGNSIASLSAGATTLSGSSTFEYEYDSTNPGSLAAAADLLVVNGNLSIGSGAIVAFDDLAASPLPFADNTTIFALINYAGTWDGGLFTYQGVPLADGATFSVGTQQWLIDYNRASSAGLDNFTSDYVSGSFVTITAVPEPSNFLIAVAGLACGGYSMWQRRKHA
jgi:autotransporter-associated beta strand protein